MCWYGELQLVHAIAERGAPVSARVLRAWLGIAALLSAAAAAALAGGCSSSSDCGAEVCDGIDNDCDGETDEHFIDGDGRYVSVSHCGTCAIDCDEVHPTAAETACRIEEGEPICRITRCPPGQRAAGDGACVSDVEVLCLPCSSDEDCELRSEDARCLIGPDGSAHCGRACDGPDDCPGGFQCQPQQGGGAPQCAPLRGGCACTAAMEGAVLGCEIRLDERTACAGEQICQAQGLGPCTPSLDERCNGVDDDCDAAADEDFVDSQGRYVSVDHCGGCNMPCVTPGPNMVASCEVGSIAPSCEVSCEAGFVEVDQIPATGCECELMDGPGVVIGGDADCDGEVDPTPQFVFVSQAGDESNNGVDFDSPLPTLQAGLALGRVLDRDVLVARGIYGGPVELLDGVSVYGGYSLDYSERDPALHPVLIEAPDGAGAPVLIARGLISATRVDGLTVTASEADTPSGGSTAVFLDRSRSALRLSRITVVAARGATGLAGEDSSAGLAAWGLDNLGQLEGVAGGSGLTHNPPLQACPPVAAGAGGDKQCFGGAVGGGRGGDAICPDMPECDNDTDTPCGNAGCTDFNNGGLCDADAIAAAEAAGHPNPPAQSGLGPASGSAGEQTYSSPTNRGTCNFCDDGASLLREGDGGQDGGRGADGVGGPGCGGGGALLDLARGVGSAGDGIDGGDGLSGSGGGGGTAGAGYAKIANTVGNCTSVSGGSGGGGGSGGCGAPAARGGGGGGASIGILIRLADGTADGPRMEAVEIVTASGGDGGDGGVGAEGGAPGAGGLGGPTTFWCSRNGGRGGDGGAGGDGGGGGGGCGGGSYGAYILGGSGDTGPYRDSIAASTTVNAAGIGGRRGRGGYSPGNPGGNGLGSDTADVFLLPN